MARSHTASDQLVERLLEWGVDVVFGLPGDGINEVMEALRTPRDRVRFVHVRHEETAALAACAFGKFAGRPAACLSTAAPGAVHLMNGPMTPIINPEHAKGVAWGLARGEPNRERIALTMSRVLAREMSYQTSPSGAVARVAEKLGVGGDGRRAEET